MGEILMDEIEKPFHIKNKLNHPTIEDVAKHHNQILNDMLSFPSINNLNSEQIPLSPLRTPNNLYKDKLFRQIKSNKEKTTDKK